MHVEFAGRAESLHHRHGAATAAVSRKARMPGAASLEGEDRPDERADRQRQCVGSKRAQHPHGGWQRENELAHRHVRKDVIDQMGRAVCHAPAETTRAEATVFATERDRELMRAVTALQAAEPELQPTALQVVAQRARYESRDGRVPLGTAFEETGEAPLDRLVEQRLLGSMPGVLVSAGTP